MPPAEHHARLKTSEAKTTSDSDSDGEGRGKLFTFHPNSGAFDVRSRRA
jgi:hypothetical protein